LKRLVYKIEVGVPPVDLGMEGILVTEVVLRVLIFHYTMM